MLHFLLFFLFGALSSLFSSSDWDEDNNYSRSLVSYGGISFYCDNGCGDPKYDSEEAAIEWLYTCWLDKPLYASQPFSRKDNHFIEKFGLCSWTGNQFFDTSMRSFFWEDELNETHTGFLKISSDFLAGLLEIRNECEKNIEESKQNIKTIEDLQSQGARFIEINGDEIEGYERCSWKSTPIAEAIQDEIRAIAFQQSDLEECDQYQKYAENTFDLIDSLYRNIFVWCLEHHQPEGIIFKEAVENFIAADYDKAIEQIRFLISLSEKRAFNPELISKLYLLKGQFQSEFCQYSDAIIALTIAIEKDPTQKETYFERAVAYFELGQFEKSLEDYLLSDFENISPKNKLQRGFFSSISSGVVMGILEGAANSATEFVPETLSSLRGIGNGLWAFSKDPIGASVAFVEAATQCIEYLVENSSVQIAQDLVPELKKLIQNYDDLADFEKGKLIGYIIGKYGADILMCQYSVKAVKAYRNLKKANQLMTLEALASPKNVEKTLQEASQKFWAQRTAILKQNNLKIHQGRQGKHLEDHINYQELKKRKKNPSIFQHPDPQRLLQTYAGTGRKVSRELPGTTGYREIVDFEEFIGYAVNEITGEKTATTFGKIHYAKDGVHIVPCIGKN